MSNKMSLRGSSVPLLVVGLCGLFSAMIFVILSFKESHTPESLIGDVEPSEMMVNYRNALHEPSVIKVTENIHVAVGFALGNVIMLEAPDGMIIVDTTECMASAKTVYGHMRKLTKKPVKAIVYTHNHPDHTQGAKAFCVDSGDGEEAQIWAHHTFSRELSKYITVQEVLFPRSMRQFGAQLPDQVNAGIGGSLVFNSKAASCIGMMQPTHLIHNDIMEVDIAGLTVQFMHIPGETDDQIGVWLPGEKAFLAADDIYQAFPNLYAIRGTPIRDVVQWLKSVDQIRNLQPRYLVPSHGRPLSGEQEITEIMTVYRDGIQYVHDQTVRYINKGLHPQDIALLVKLPPALRDHPYLVEMYGTMEWSVRSIFNQYLGWFSGNVAELHAMGTTETAQNMVRLAGGWDKMVSEAKRTLGEGDAKWALTLTSHLFVLNPQDDQVLDIRLQAMKQLARAMPSPNGRHYYLSTALEDFRLVDLQPSEDVVAGVLRHMTLDQIFLILRSRLDPKLTEGVHEGITFNFTDVNQTYTATIRNSIMEVVPGDDSSSELRLTLSTQLWIDLLARKVSAIAAYMDGRLVVDGKLTSLKRFFDYFER